MRKVHAIASLRYVAYQLPGRTIGVCSLISLNSKNSPTVIMATLMVSNPQVNSSLGRTCSVESLCRKPEAVIA